ncbi:MAG TPA: hypothetical protein VGM73_05750 [Candidatus Didemnitutus sp.]|jgi:hypothetical protein
MNWRSGFVALATIALAVAALPAQEWRLDTTYTWETNLSRTSNAPDWENGALYDATLTGAWHRQLAPDWLATGQIEAGAEQVRPFPGLDNESVAAEFDLRRKFGLGPFAPTLTFMGRVGYLDFHEDDRSHENLQTGLTLAKRLTETWRLSASGTWNEDRASVDPFSIRNQRLTIETDWEVIEGWQLTGGASRLWGQLTANANEDVFAQAQTGSLGPAAAAYYRSVAFEHSTAFDTDWVAYRIDCRADLWWAGITIALGEHTSLPLRYESANVTNRAQVSYRSELWSLSVVHRF